MRFTHLATKKVKKFKTPKCLGISFKPAGCLWVACEKEWEEWIVDNLPQEWIESYKYKYDVDVDISNLIVLKTYKNIKAFSDRFCIEFEEDVAEKINPVFKNDLEFRKYTLVDWNRVRKETGAYGIFVEDANIKKARREFTWYTSFDVCSVGIWDERAIRSLDLAT